MKKDVKHWISDEVKDKIAIKYKEPAWITLTEVRDGTGFMTAGKTADAIAFGVWPSRGLSIIGFEVKVSRSDWLSELKNPAKAESMAQHCNAWYIVAPEGVVKEEEVPPNWGYYLVTKRGLKTIKEATYNDNKDGPVNRLFIMSVIRNVSRNYVSTTKLNELIKSGIKDHQESWNYEHKREKDDHNALKKKVKEFEDASGVNLGQWGPSPKKMGEVVKYLSGYEFEADFTNAVEKATRLKDALEGITTVELFKWIKKVKELERT